MARTKNTKNGATAFKQYPRLKQKGKGKDPLSLTPEPSPKKGAGKK